MKLAERKLGGKTLLKRTRCKWEDIIEMDIWEILYGLNEHHLNDSSREQYKKNFGFHERSKFHNS